MEGQVYKQLKVLMEEPDKPTFEKLLQGCIYVLSLIHTLSYAPLGLYCGIL